MSTHALCSQPSPLLQLLAYVHERCPLSAQQLSSCLYFAGSKRHTAAVQWLLQQGAQLRQPQWRAGVCNNYFAECWPLETLQVRSNSNSSMCCELLCYAQVLFV
jgi:hypothetical protein